MKNNLYQTPAKIPVADELLSEASTNLNGVSKKEPAACHHCGDPCLAEDIEEDDYHFCCAGCQTVYHLLSDSGLHTYYKLEDTPGISMKGSDRKKRYEHLDDPSVMYKILDFYDGKNAKVTMRTPQIHCNSCVWLLENLHRLNDAVKKSEVFFGKREVEIFYDPNKLKLSELAGLLSRIGYEPDLSLGRLDQKEEKKSLNPLYLKIGIAGFAFGNIMLFSLPEYLAGSEGVDRQFIHLFGLLNIALALPVFLYSSIDFYRSAWLSVQQKQWNMDIAISLGIAAMFFRSLYEIFSGYGVGYMDSFAMLVFLLLVGRLFQHKTYETLSFDRDYKAYFPLSVIRSKNGEEESVPVTNLEVDDEVVIRSGELIPADATLLDDEAHIDYSFVSGESDPVKASKGGLIYAGGRLYGASTRFKVEKPVSQSYLTRLWNNAAFQKTEKEGVRYASQKVSRYFSPAVIGIAILAAVYWLPANPANAINAFTAVLIIACPCALALSAPFTLGWTTSILGKNKCYIKNGEVAERMAQADTVVFDKTGTLTWTEKAEVDFEGSSISERDLQVIRSVVHNSTHPLSRKLYAHLSVSGEGKLLPVSNYEEFPGKGIEAEVDGKIIRVGSGKWVGIPEQQEPQKAPETSQVFVSVDGQILGQYNIRSAYRPGLKELFSDLGKRAKYYLISGDNDREKDRLSDWFGTASEMRFNQTPEDKLKFIDALSNDGAHVVMVGDGLNDAGALKSSDVGISIAEDTGNFTPASDVILEADSLPQLEKFMSFSRKSLNIIYISFAISVLYNIIGLSYAVTATLSPLICAIIMPVSSISVILFTTLGTNLSAQKLGLRAWK